MIYPTPVYSNSKTIPSYKDQNRSINLSPPS
jgi:hypothetical protein